ncbi:hypothetical protein K491DRAFT_683842 [Lophiostoma macrostomum CBS 122681]|uniref:Uncharacterized protein n=1 Tax=Lophiostoma macrostomum CBS 122681 TaxID=1314788 RepID=A0A6A6SNM6_9PLEO|nr:hypothetical protein K491DRAFT_683842 [Lophiostoma macrostomum CBS 122681]
MLRPWIFSEMKLMLHNPHELVYVGHAGQGTKIRMSLLRWMGYIPRSRFDDTSFAKELRHAWASDFVTPVLEILNGSVSMTDIHDFKFILPMLADVLVAAEQLERNDYLLTVALLASASRHGRVQEYVIDGAFTRLPYRKLRIWSRVKNKEWYDTVARTKSSFQVFIQRDEIHRVFWHDHELATLEYHEKDWRKDDIPQYTLRLAQDMERRVFEMLELDSEAFSQFVVRENERRAYMGDPDLVAGPKIKVVEIRR